VVKLTAFIAKAQQVHDRVYTYHNSIYVNTHTKLLVTCNEHGDFLVTPNNHISKLSGCKQCSISRRATKRSLTTAQWVERANTVHAGFYDYGLVDYVNIHSKVTIVCPDHGIFTQQPINHTKQQQGCPTCYRETPKNMFESKANMVHKNKYCYSLSNYIHSNTPITIICNKHGQFSQTPNNHLLGHGCSKCSNTYTPPVGVFFDICNQVHQHGFDYDESSYINLKSKLRITCSDHGEFIQSASTHMHGGICPKCMYKMNLGYSNIFFAKYPYKKVQPCIVYLVRLTSGHEEFYKIGITVRDVVRRFRVQNKYTVEQLCTIPTTLYWAVVLEQDLLDLVMIDSQKYIPRQQLSGKHECFVTSNIQPYIDAFAHIAAQ